MYTIKQTPEFEVWLKGLRDNITRLKLNRRLDKAGRGLLGDVAPVGDGVYEFREHYGPGWRMYYIQRGDTMIVMLGGGDKSTQQKDIDKAIAISKTLED